MPQPEPAPRTRAAALRRLALAATLGAAASIATAWALAIWSPFTSGSLPPESPLILGYPAMIPGPYPGMDGWWATGRGVGTSSFVLFGARGSEGEFHYWQGSHTPSYYWAGWPAKCLESVVTSIPAGPYTSRELTRWDLPSREILHRGLATNDLPPWLRAQPERRIPLNPLWSGLAIDTALFGTLSWFVLRLAARSAARRHLRHPA